MNTPRQNDLGIFTRIIHLGLVIFGLLAWGTGEWGDAYKKLKHIGFYVHSWIGIALWIFDFPAPHRLVGGSFNARLAERK